MSDETSQPGEPAENTAPEVVLRNEDDDEACFSNACGFYVTV